MVSDNESAITLTVSTAEARIFLDVLERIRDYLGSRACNDYHLVREGRLTPAEANALLQAMRARSEHPDDLPDGRFVIADVDVVAHLQAAIRRAMAKETA